MPILPTFFEEKGNDGDADINCGEEQIVIQEMLKGARVIDGMLDTLESAPEKRKDKGKIDKGGQERKDNLEDENIWHGDESKTFAPSYIEKEDAMLPKCLDSAVHPAEALADKSSDGFRRFSKTKCILVVSDTVVATDNGKSHICIFCEGARRKSTRK